MGLVFHKLHITEDTVIVPNNLLYLQIVLKDIPWSRGGQLISHVGYFEKPAFSGGPYLLISLKINKYDKKIMTPINVLLQFFLCKYALSSARNSVRQMKSHKVFNIFQIWRFFLKASADHWKRCSGPHVASEPLVAQARRQDIAARGPKTRSGGHISKILY